MRDSIGYIGLKTTGTQHYQLPVSELVELQKAAIA